MRRTWGSMIGGAALLLSVTASSFAGTSAPAQPMTAPSQQGALAPAGSAGVKQAELVADSTLFIVVGTAVVAGGLCLVLCGGGKGSVTTTTSGVP